LDYLVSFGKDAESLVEPLIQLLLDEQDPYVLGDIRDVLAAIGSSSELALVAASKNANEQQLIRIVETVGMVGATHPETLDFLKHHLMSENPKMVIASCRSIELIGKQAHSLLPQLISIAQRPRVPLAGEETAHLFRDSRDVAAAAVGAMAEVGADESAVPVLIDCLGMEPNIAEKAAEALEGLGPRASSALAALRELQNRDDHGGRDVKTKLARDAAAKAIQAIGPASN
jgi:hypothetical protein